MNSIDNILESIKNKVSRSIMMDDFALFVKRTYNIKLYPYQRRLGEAIVGRQIERVAAIYPRQSGKSLTMVFVALYLLIKYPGFHIGIFAPKERLGKVNIFKKVRDYLARSPDKDMIKKDSATRMELKNGSLIFCESAGPTAKITGPDLDLAIVDESQDVIARKIKMDITYMLGAKNGTLALVGSAIPQRCYFHDCLNNPNIYTIIEATDEEAARNNPEYRKFREVVARDHGKDSIEYRSQVKCEWLFDIGMFVTGEQLEALEYPIKWEPSFDYYAGLDTAKKRDRTVFTLMRISEDGFKEIVDWIEFEGEDYDEQFDIIVQHIKGWNVRVVCVDSTGQQDIVVDMLKGKLRATGALGRVQIIGVVMTTPTQHRIFKQLEQDIMRKHLRIPQKDTDLKRHFWDDMINLTKVYRGHIMRVSADRKNNEAAHDDYADSWALAVEACNHFARIKEHSNIEPITHDKEGREYFERLSNVLRK